MAHNPLLSHCREHPFDMSKHYSHDILVIGSGAAGLTLALSLANQYRVAVLSKGEVNEGSTWFAQGGIAAVLDDEDSVEAHVKTPSTPAPDSAMKTACDSRWSAARRPFSGLSIKG